MEGLPLYDTIYQLSHYAPLVILIAALLDIFFMTGLILYGAAMMSTVLMLHMSGMISTQELIVSAFIGTTIGNILNYWTGRLFGETAFIQNRLDTPRLRKTKHFLQSRGLIVFMTTGRFITFTRPLYALLLGSLQIKFSRFLAVELPLALFWVTFWLLVILEGEYLIERFWS